MTDGIYPNDPYGWCGMFVDRAGKPISSDEQSEKMLDIDYKRVKLTEIGKYTISTVWTGDYAGGLLKPFETMVSHQDVGDELVCERRMTEAEAEAFHDEFVAGLQACLDAGVDFAEMVLYVRGQRDEMPALPPSVEFPSAQKLANLGQLQVKLEALAAGELICEEDSWCDKAAKYMDGDGSVYCEDDWYRRKHGDSEPEPIV